MSDDQMHKEWELWKALGEALKASGVVTESDLNSPIYANMTPGQKIFQLIREWGQAKSDLDKQMRK